MRMAECNVHQVEDLGIQLSDRALLSSHALDVEVREHNAVDIGQQVKELARGGFI